MTDLDAAGRSLPWWRQAVMYQVYPRSFVDADGDGVGDLRGVTSRVPYLRDLGVDGVWLSPFYPSALADGGYDVDDHRNVDPRLGTLADFDELVVAVHEAGLRIVVDVVPNHTSDRHAWFTEALASPAGSPARARYIFRDGRGADGSRPPSSWDSIFGGSAWQRVVEPDGTPGQWYLHMFAEQQPDLDWSNPEVREDMLGTLRFWADRGVDGFRVDVAHGLVKDVDGHLDVHVDSLDMDRTDGSHPLWDRDELVEVYRAWREVLDSYDPPLSAVAEASVHPARRGRYADPATLGQAFNFDLFAASWDPVALRTAIEDGLEQARAGSSATWTLSNHDSVRHASRFGLPPEAGRSSHEVAKRWVTTDGRRPPLDPELGLRRARAAVLLELALPGAVYLYQGEELGLHEVPDLPWDVLEDPIARRSGGTEKGRDGCRVPLPWTATGPSLGFGPAGASLPQPSWFAAAAVESQVGVEGSTVELYRRALALRRELTGADESVEWVPSPPHVLHLVRPGGWHSVTTVGGPEVPLPPGELLLRSDRAGPDAEGMLSGDATAWVRGADTG